MKIRYSSAKKLAPDHESGVKVLYAPAKRTAYRIRWFAILLMVFSPLMLLLWYGMRDNVLVLAPGLVSLEPRPIFSAGEGFVHHIHVEPGTLLKPGEKIMTIVSPEIETTIADLKEQLSVVSSNVELDASFEYAKTNLENHLKVVKQNLENQRGLLNQYRDLNEKGLVPAVELANMQQLFSRSQVSVLEAELALNNTKASQAKDAMVGDLAESRREINQQLTKFRTLREILKPVSVTDSKIIDIYVHEGEWVTKSQQLALISEREIPVAAAYLDPKYISHTAVGKTASVTFPNGQKIIAVVDQSEVLMGNLPKRLAGPFESNQAVLKVTLAFQEPLPKQLLVEGLPIEVRWHVGKTYRNNANRFLTWVHSTFDQSLKSVKQFSGRITASSLNVF